jgi:hypothetical protein
MDLCRKLPLALATLRAIEKSVIKLFLNYLLINIQQKSIIRECQEKMGEQWADDWHGIWLNATYERQFHLKMSIMADSEERLEVFYRF